jgi:hypothetical protein
VVNPRALGGSPFLVVQPCSTNPFAVEGDSPIPCRVEHGAPL